MSLQENINRPNTLFYAPSFNRFIDDQWYVVHNLNRIFDVWQLDKWKKSKKDTSMQAKNGVIFKLYYLTDEEEDDMLDFICWNESYEIKMDRMDY